MYYQFALRFLLISLIFTSCQAPAKNREGHELRLGCERLEEYLPLLNGKQVGLLVNHTSLVGQTHLIDTLLTRGINVAKIYAPEHGFRGKADAGEHIKSGQDVKTGLPVVSLYGKHKKPNKQDLEGVDVVIFDIQDVGARFYTYISSMHYMMEACAENSIPMLVLDRPNPNGDYYDGPVLDLEFQSFVGMHPIPIVHGLTVGELAQMINGERWLNDSVQCDLQVVKMDNYRHEMAYSLPVKPSPNLPNDISIRLYPSLCFFEATEISVGRGTYMPFQVIGYPDSTYGDFTFTPVSIEGMSKHPPQQDKLCYGVDLRNEPLAHRFTLSYLLTFYEKSNFSDSFISRERWFNLLAGNDTLLKKIEAGWSEVEIRASWSNELEDYATLRKQYLLYP
ncbi:MULTISPECIES: exo-beta-N-acetylmuramidase NamZ family protein [unclassified Carboxylicivirga]|uniref:exo-beta-N-acetylmuramidase NamZ family protein n=1 Tax=Carboxylicivirga TaxID=1628153 RepID=UPI003D33A27D